MNALQTRFCFAILILLFSTAAFAQRKLVVEGTKGRAYIHYPMHAGETFGSVAMLFKTNVPDILSLNGFSASTQIPVGREIKIPFNPQVLHQYPKAPLLPTAVVHKVAPGENLYRISLAHNNISMDTLKKWNELPIDAVVSHGSEVIVGYLPMAGLGHGYIVKRASSTESSIVKSATPPVENKNLTKQNVNDAVDRTAKNASNKKEQVQPAERIPNDANNAMSFYKRGPDKKMTDPDSLINRFAFNKNTAQRQKADYLINQFAFNKKGDASKTQTPNNNFSEADKQSKPETAFAQMLNGSLGKDSLQKTNIVKLPAATGSYKDSIQKEKPVNSSVSALAAKTQTQEPVFQNSLQPANPDDFFSESFGKDVSGLRLITLKGNAMAFKSPTGWDDKKYYILADDLPAGAIVKVTIDGSKYIYAKVLWNLGGIKPNEGLEYRINDAAAAVLGVKEPKFPLTVSLFKSAE